MAKPKKQKRPALPPKASRAAVDVARNAIAKPPPGNAKAALYLCVPFAEKETARNLGARWDSQVKFLVRSAWRRYFQVSEVVAP